MNSDNIQDEINVNNLSNNIHGGENIISYLSDIFLGKNNEDGNNINFTHDDISENFEESYDNLIKLSKMNIGKLCEYFEINNDISNQKQNSYNKKYSNILINTNNYETDYELKINSNETMTFLKSKK